MQGKSSSKPLISSRRLAGRVPYVSPNAQVLPGFESTFEQQLTKNNRWVVLSSVIPWDRIVQLYEKQFTSKEGRPHLNGRIVVGATIIKHMLNISDQETVMQIQENPFMQYFLGFSTFTNERIFDASLFVDIRKRLTPDVVDAINKIALHNAKVIIEQPDADDTTLTPTTDSTKEKDEPPPPTSTSGIEATTSNLETDTTSTETTACISSNPIIHKGKLLVDATVCPQDITFPTDVKLLNAARIKSEELIDKLYAPIKKEFGDKPRTYRKLARKDFLNFTKKKQPSLEKIYAARAEQLSYLKRNLGYIDELKAFHKQLNPTLVILKPKDEVYLETLTIVYYQQSTMQRDGTKSCADRIVNIHQPHVRPMPRGKAASKVEFGSKIHVSVVDGYAVIDQLSWNPFNESTLLIDAVEGYKKRYGFYPEEVLADQIYGSRTNRQALNKLGIKLVGKQLGRPKANQAVDNHLRPGERNPVEGKFGQAKQAYGLDRIRAKLRDTSESWIYSIIMVTNLVKLMRVASSWTYLTISKCLNYLMCTNRQVPSLTASPI